MWTLPLPPVDGIDDHLTTALTLASGQPAYALSDVERAAVFAVYQAYDALLGQPGPALVPAALLACRQHIEAGYDQLQIGKRLGYLRASLLAKTDCCPYCGFGEPTQLDHYLPKTHFGELAIYPRNLIPSCGPCNNAKRTIVPGVGPQAGLIHAYFQDLPDIVFMRAEIAFVDGALDVTFGIEVGLVPQPLEQMLQYQLVRLKLNTRYPKQVNKFLSEQRTSILMFREMGADPAMLARYFMRSARSLAENFGLNDWRPALLNALAENAAFCAEPEIYLGEHIPATAHEEGSVDT